MKTSTLKRTANLIATIFFILVTIGMMQGSVQNIIHFAGVANEIGFTFMSALLVVIFATYTVSE